jgi:ankyrin repeat protein
MEDNAMKRILNQLIVMTCLLFGAAQLSAASGGSPTSSLKRAVRAHTPDPTYIQSLLAQGASMNKAVYDTLAAKANPVIAGILMRWLLQQISSDGRALVKEWIKKEAALVAESIHDQTSTGPAGHSPVMSSDSVTAFLKDVAHNFEQLLDAEKCNVEVRKTLVQALQRVGCTVFKDGITPSQIAAFDVALRSLFNSALPDQAQARRVIELANKAFMKSTCTFVEVADAKNESSSRAGEHPKAGIPLPEAKVTASLPAAAEILEDPAARMSSACRDCKRLEVDKLFDESTPDELDRMLRYKEKPPLIAFLEGKTHVTSLGNFTKMLTVLLNHYAKYPDQHYSDVQDNDGKTALMVAVQQGNTVAVKLLLAAKASTTIQDKLRRTAMSIALTARNQDILKLFFASSVPSAAPAGELAEPLPVPAAVEKAPVKKAAKKSKKQAPVEIQPLPSLDALMHEINVATDAQPKKSGTRRKKTGKASKVAAKPAALVSPASVVAQSAEDQNRAKQLQINAEKREKERREAEELYAQVQQDLEQRKAQVARTQEEKKQAAAVVAPAPVVDGDSKRIAAAATAHVAAPVAVTPAITSAKLADDFCEACNMGYVDAARTYLERGVSVDSAHSETRVPAIVSALLLNRVDVVQLLLSRGADMGVMHNGQTLFDLARSPILKLLEDEQDRRAVQDPALRNKTIAAVAKERAVMDRQVHELMAKMAAISARIDFLVALDR